MLVLGVAGSPRQGNTELMVQEALEGAGAVEGVQTEFYGLHGKKVGPCVDCGKCPVPGQLCSIRDSMQEVYQKLLAADGIILGAPVYCGTVNAQTKALMDRCRPVYRQGMLLRFKVGGAVAVGAGRHAGQEASMRAIHDYFLLQGMVSVSHPGYLGAAGLAWKPGMVKHDRWVVEQNPEGELDAFRIARLVGLRVGLVTKMMVAGRATIDPGCLPVERPIGPQA